MVYDDHNDTGCLSVSVQSHTRSNELVGVFWSALWMVVFSQSCLFSSVFLKLDFYILEDRRNGVPCSKLHPCKYCI